MLGNGFTGYYWSVEPIEEGNAEGFLESNRLVGRRRGVRDPFRDADMVLIIRDFVADLVSCVVAFMSPGVEHGREEFGGC